MSTIRAPHFCFCVVQKVAAPATASITHTLSQTTRGSATATYALRDDLPLSEISANAQCRVHRYFLKAGPLEFSTKDLAIAGRKWSVLDCSLCPLSRVGFLGNYVSRTPKMVFLERNSF